MRIDSNTRTVKSPHGRITGYRASYQDLETYPESLTKPEAENKLAALVQFRCQRESAHVRVFALRGYVGIFTYAIDGAVETRMIQPGFEGVLQSSSSGRETFADAVDSFRYHVAQLTWDGTLDAPDYLPESRSREFIEWAKFQLRYKIAIHQGMKDGEAHQWACDSRNPHTAPGLE